MSDEALHIYLDDHLALMTAETELAKRVARENEGAELAAFLDDYTFEVQRQKQALEQPLGALDAGKRMAKQAAGWLAEKLGRLKPNDSLSGYTDLARVIELEGLIAAADARMMLWQTLGHIQRLSALGSAQLKVKTEQQLAKLREHHEQAAKLAFG